jgi:hypothetical protein
MALMRSAVDGLPRQGADGLGAKPSSGVSWRFDRPSPLSPHSFGMQHQVIGCASLAAIDISG